MMPLLLFTVYRPKKTFFFYRVTKPGGFIEIVEYISPENSGPVLTNVYKTRK